MPISKTTDKFIEEALIVHGDKFDYSEVKYLNNNTKIKLKCNTCFTIFEQRPKCHLRGKGCLECVNRSRSSTIDIFIKNARKIHGEKYDYSKAVYVNNQTKMIIKCNTCSHVFSQSSACHVNYKKGCPSIYCRANFFLTTELFIERALLKHGKQYDYSNTEYKNGRCKVTIKCNKCNKIFNEKASSHLEGNGCPFCCSSKGEIKISRTLDKFTINYKSEYLMKCKYKKRLRVDFFLPDYNAMIEFDGKQHFEESNYFCGKLEANKEKDMIKTRHCAANNLSLLRIHYKDFDRIEELIVSFLNFIYDNPETYIIKFSRDSKEWL